MTQEIVDAVKALETEKGIDADTLMDALADALLSAYKKTPGAAKYAKVELDHGTADFRVFEIKVPDDLEQRLLDEQFEEQLQAAEAAEAAGEPVPEIQQAGPTIDPETGERRESEEPEVEPERLEPYAGDLKTQDVTPDDFGRIAAQTAKQVILQRIREAERGMMYDEYKDRVGELVTGIIQQSDNRYTLVQLRERVEALLPRSEQVYNERYDHGMRVKAVITDVSAENKGPSIVVSRRNPELIKKLFELEVPEIADKLVEITGVAREPGWRSKIAVISHADGVDPVGACVGPRGSRVRMVVSELRGEKIDIIPYNEEPARFVAKALSPARVREVLVDDETKEATVIVPDDQLSLAIGRDGQNARLAARLTGWKVDITSETEFSQQEDEIEYEGEEAADGRCGAMLDHRPPLPQRGAGRLPLLRAAPASGAGAVLHQPGRRARPAQRGGGRDPGRTRKPTTPRSPRSSSAPRPSSSRPRRSRRSPRKRRRPPRTLRAKPLRRPRKSPPRKRRPPPRSPRPRSRSRRPWRPSKRLRPRPSTPSRRGSPRRTRRRRWTPRRRPSRSLRRKRQPRKPMRRRPEEAAGADGADGAAAEIAEEAAEAEKQETEG